MKGFDVLHVKSAVKSHNKFDLSRSHLTTMNFGEIVPLMTEETVPGDRLNVSAQYFSRLAPLVKPTYGKFNFKTVSGFVPYHQVAVDADAWLAGKTAWEGQVPHHRWFNINDLAGFIINYCVTSTGATSTNSQFTYITSSGNSAYRLFTKEGKYYIKVLNALGYTLPQGVDLQSTSVWSTSTNSTRLSAYPLLAFFKLYNDYMSQSQRFNSSPLSDLLYRIKYNVAYSGMWNASSGQITSLGIKTMFENLYLNYENDYFTSAWQRPNNAINSVENVSGLSVPTTPSTPLGTVVDTVDSNSLQLGVVSNTVTLGQRALEFLRAFDDWVRRNNYSGSRSVQQIYSRFGIKTDEYKSHYANVISTDSLPIQIGDVTATADSTSVPLGDYAGKGIMSGNKSVNIQVSDYGLFIILGYFTVVPMMSFGADRKVLRNAPMDYYNPEFDGIGADAIPYMEVFASPIADNTDTTQDIYVYGFTERYNSYRYSRDMITGEFRDYRPNGDMTCWHSGRNLSALRKANSMVAQSTSMNTLPQIDSEYNRIFSVTSGDVDHFYLTANFAVDALRPMLNLNQVPKLGEGDTAVPRNGNVIS